MKRNFALGSLVLLLASTSLIAQDWIRTGTGLGVEKVRLAVPDFRQATADSTNQNLATVFNATLWSDLLSAGIFEMVSKSYYPLAVPGMPQDVKPGEWSTPPPNASM